jgi:hypothetical protein
VHWCAAPNPAEPLRHNGTAPVRMRRVPPKRRVLRCARVEPKPTDPVACEHPIPHKRKAVTQAAVDTEALACSGSSCSSP